METTRLLFYIKWAVFQLY